MRPLGNLIAKSAAQSLLIGLLLGLFSSLSTAADTEPGTDTLPPLHLGDMKRERFSVVEDGKLVGGINLEIFAELAERLNLQTEHSYCPFKRCLAKLARNKIDMMMWIVKAPHRDQHIDYIQVWPGLTNIHFYTRAGDAQQLQAYEDLRGLRIGVIRGFYYTRQFDLDKSITKTAVETEEQLPRMLITKRIDAFPVYGSSHVHIASEYPQLELSEFKIPSRDMGVLAISKKSPYVAMIPEIDAALLDMIYDGTLDRIWEKYHPGRLAPVPDYIRQANPALTASPEAE
ncbi:MAG: hypothetical protein AseanaTS_15740 [Candidatus Pelagadaptatus aseana]|uniref:substrate-binding periplasmic protein n=1 Tax=Candidatus Pelagadaptatus aseana TaxID=3120508 RepID=UPI0039B33B4A